MNDIAVALWGSMPFVGLYALCGVVLLCLYRFVSMFFVWSINLNGLGLAISCFILPWERGWRYR